ncbi:MAG: tetratricopeptide repeat protein [Nitrospirota bacterium]|nr:tetratricopeptide repeat protein [Nitrospirota bacterium]
MTLKRVLAGVLALGVGLPSLTWADHLPEAEVLMDDRRYEVAIPLLETESREEPDNARVWFLLGVAYSEQERSGDARAAFEKTLALDPTHGLAHYNLAILLFRAAQWEQAASEFLSTARARPQLASAAYLNAGLARLKQGREADARALFQEAAAVGPGTGSGKSAVQMLAALDGNLPGATPASDPTEAARKSPDHRWDARLTLRREFDSNVFATPDDPTTGNQSDQRIGLSARLARSFALSGARRMEVRYDLFAREYDTLSQLDLTTHTLRVRMEHRKTPRRSRWEYAFSSSTLGTSAYMASHTAGARWTLSRGGQRSTYLYTRIKRYDASAAYGYLSGTGAEAILARYRPLGMGSLYTSVSAEYLDRKDRPDFGAVAGVQHVSYSHAGFSPSVSLVQPFFFGLTVDLGARYQYRGYLDADVWNFGATRRKRQDHKLSMDLAVTRDLGNLLELELGWRRELRRSNIDSAADYTDRDYQRNVYTVAVTGRY